MLLFYNLGPGRTDIRVARELLGMATMRPLVIGLVEAVGYRLPRLRGYRLIRDTSRPGRANVAAYVRDDCRLSRIRWVDLAETWSRTEMPGTHPARSILILRVGEVQVLVHHQPPKGTDNTASAQLEGVRALDGLMSPVWSPLSRHRPRVLLWDANRLPGEPGPGPDSLALRITGTVSGDQIDGAVSRRLPIHRWLYRKQVPGTLLGSDHRHGAFQLVLTDGVRW